VTIAHDEAPQQRLPPSARPGLLSRLPVRAVMGLALAFVVTVSVVAGFRAPTGLRDLEAGLNDTLRVIFSPYSTQQDPQISILAITEDTLARFPYRSPVDRDFLADLVEKLHGAGAKAVGLDILIDQATEPGKDDRLARALHAFDGPAVVAWADARAGLRPAQDAFLNDFIARAGAIAGSARLIYDDDGVVRRFSVSSGGDAHTLPAALIEGTGDAVTIQDGLIDWRREAADGAAAFQILPSHALMNPALPAALFRGWFGGRYVLIGADLEQTDRHETSLAADPTIANRTQPGVLIHAHVLSQMLDTRSVRDWPVDDLRGAGLVAALTLIGAALGLRGGSLALKAALLAGTGAVWLGLAAGLADMHGPYLPIAPPLLGLGIAFGFGGVAEAFLAAREKAFIRQAFSHYLEPAMVDRLARDRNSLRLGGERRELSFLFTDIAGFTEMSEQLPPEELTGLLNDYFDGMSDVIAAHHGMIDKFIGDAVVALFGAPTADANHALNAVRAAAAMDAFAEDFRRGHRGQGIGITRIGVHTGMASVGNFGGRKRFDYTAMGDAMNTAARLESVNKTLGTRVTVSGAARAAAMAQAGGKVSALPTLRPAGRLALKGKAAATEAWNLCDGLDRDLQDDYAAAFALMAAGDPGAAQAFADLAARFPGDPLTALHLRRLQAGQTSDQVGLG
jgi:adenylate cyclase